MNNTKDDKSLPQVINLGNVKTQINIGENKGNINIKVEKSNTELSELSSDKIKEQFQQASHILSDYQNFFEGLPESHFDRKETEELFQWVKSPVIGEVKPIAMVVGDAGNGKSVILKDLWKKLDDEEIPVLGIKADRYYVESIKELEERLGVDDKLEAMVRKLQKERKNVVILIDQIDALSLSLSTNRNYITVYVKYYANWFFVTFGELKF
jgi:Cdc6-like AAA superfamily ATPase